jgi:hypothetical protein
LVKEELAEETGIATIFMLQTQTAQDKLDDSLFELERAIQAEAEKQAKAKKDLQQDADSDISNPSEDIAPKPVPMPRPVVEVSASKIFGKLASGIYLEKQEDVDQFVNALQDELQTAIAAGKRVRLK